MRRSWRLLVPLLVSGLLAAGDASAHRVQVRCRDGTSMLPIGRADSTQIACDTDGRCDAVCSFDVPACDAGGCGARSIAVPVHRRRTLRIVVEPGGLPTSVVLACGPHSRRIPCPTVTTTTGGPTTTRPGHLGGPSPGATTSTTNPKAGSHPVTTTTAARSSTTTSTLPRACLVDGDCLEAGNRCVASFCKADRTCAPRVCVCITAERQHTCRPAEAGSCMNAGDCPLIGGEPCRACVGGICMTAPNCF
jgi:hypothetical protein